VIFVDKNEDPGENWQNKSRWPCEREKSKGPAVSGRRQEQRGHAV